MVDFSTRNDNTLDIFYTHRPSLAQRCLVIPGLSDYDIILVDANILPARNNPFQRLVYLWKSVNLEGMKEAICDVTLWTGSLQITALPQQLTNQRSVSNKYVSRTSTNIPQQI